MCADLCAVDYLTHPDRPLPDGVTPERFEVVVNLLSLSRRQRVRVRVQVPEADPVVRRLFDLYPGTEAMEREAYDMFGIVFEGHPDLTRILMPEDWEGHPLRKDYGVGPRAGAVQRSAGPAMSDEEPRSLRPRRSPGACKDLDETSPGASWRSSRARAVRLPEGGVRRSRRHRHRVRRDDETMIINMGPQHPSTHGVLRLMLELDGRDGAAHQADHRLPAHRHGEDGRGAHLRPGRHERHPHGLPVAPAQRAGASRWPSRRCSASRSRRGRRGSACS